MGNKVDQLEKRMSDAEMTLNLITKLLETVMPQKGAVPKKGKTSETKTQTSSGKRKKV